MKTLILTLIVTATMLTGLVNAQNENTAGEENMQTVFGSNSNAVGGYLSLGLGNTMINDNNAMLGQFRLAARLGHSFSIGIAGNGFSDRIYGLNYDRPELSTDGYYIEGGYGGILLEPVFAPSFPVHLSFPVLIGAGGVAFCNDQEEFDWDDWEYDTENNVIDRAAYFVIEPGVELEFNLARYVRMGAGVSYRFTSGFKVMDEREHLLNGLTCSLNFKLGVF